MGEAPQHQVGTPSSGWPSPPATPGTPYGQHAPGYPPPPRPVRTSLTGPIWLTGIGVVLLVAAAVAAAFVVRTFMSIVPLDVVSPDGGPGTAAIVIGPAPSTLTTELDPGYYNLFLVVDEGVRRAGLEGDAVLTGPDGTTRVVAEPPRVSADVSLGGSRAFAVGGFRVTQAGEHTIEVPAADVPDAQVVLVEGTETAAFVSGVLGTVGGTIVAIGLGVLGFGLTVGGVIWWVVRARARGRLRAAAA